jgi:RNA polymerase sigma-70 factor, ECF subfamily
MPPPNPTETRGSFTQMLQAARDGDNEAQGRLLEPCRRRLLCFAKQQSRKMLQSKASPSDAVQESFLQALQVIDTFAGCTPDQMLAWLRIILTNNLRVLSKQFNTAKRQVQREVPGQPALLESNSGLAVSSTVEAVLRHEQIERLDKAVERLPDHYKEVVRLRNSDNRSFEEIGCKIGRTAEGVRKLWRRALAELNHQLAG